MMLRLGTVCWVFFGFGFLALLVAYISGGAGLQFWIPLVSAESVLVGLVHVTGLSTASILCFAVATGLWAHSLPDTESMQKTPRTERQQYE